MGMPVMIKAAAGGGGRGMRRVADPDQLLQSIALARSEAEGAFGNGDLILDKALFRNDSPQGWNDESKSESSWEQVGSNIFNKWTES